MSATLASISKCLLDLYAVGFTLLALVPSS